MPSYSYDELSYRTRFFLMRVCPVLVFLGGLALAIFGTHRWMLASESTTWPTAEARVSSSEVRSHTSKNSDGHSSTTFSADIQYSYTVDGQTYFGDHVGFGYHHITPSEFAQALVDKYPAGTTTTISYRPSDPSFSVIEPGARAQSRLFLYFGSVICLLTVVFIAFKWRQPI